MSKLLLEKNINYDILITLFLTVYMFIFIQLQSITVVFLDIHFKQVSSIVV